MSVARDHMGRCDGHWW